MAKENQAVSIYPDEELKNFINHQATMNRRSRNAQILFWIEQIKDGKIEIKGIG